jgi:hypothetical protein
MGIMGFAALGALTFVMFLIWDAYTIYSVWSSYRGRKVPSGVPIVSLCVYVIVCVPDKQWQWLGVLTLYHFMCQFVVPITVALWFVDKKR